jgi:hypothetical protein
VLGLPSPPYFLSLLPPLLSHFADFLSWRRGRPDFFKCLDTQVYLAPGRLGDALKPWIKVMDIMEFKE